MIPPRVFIGSLNLCQCMRVRLLIYYNFTIKEHEYLANFNCGMWSRKRVSESGSDFNTHPKSGISKTNMIPPVNLDGGFSCAGNGLLYEGHARESPGQLRGLILPSGNQNGISDRDRLVTIHLCL